MRGFTDLTTEAAALMRQFSQKAIKGDMIWSIEKEPRL